ncbi:MAG: DNA repair protein RadC [Saprospiraceae bacterium]|nr:DNA repair protein RadC [Saprospiraceae bacterium]
MEKPSHQKEKLPIKSWSEDDRPREKLLNKGKQTLTDAELLAILIRVGSARETALDLAKRLLAAADNNLNSLGKFNVEDFLKFHGIKDAKAITIVAALELGRRRQLSNIKERPKITSSKDAYDVLAPILVDLPHEEFWILLLNRAQEVIAKEQMSIGGIAGTVVDIRMIFRKAIEGQASNLILMHNHPSGALQPSQADLEVTKRLKIAGETLDIQVLDHLIVSERGYFSFADHGLLS